MKVRGQHYRTIWPNETDGRVIRLIDQRFLPHRFVIEEVRTVEEMANAIKEMHVRGAGLIGAAAGYGMYLATLAAASGDSFEDDLMAAAAQLKATQADRGQSRLGHRTAVEKHSPPQKAWKRSGEWRSTPPGKLRTKTRNIAGGSGSTDWN